MTLSSNQNIDKTTSVILFFFKADFVLDTTEHIICKNGELGISCNIIMSERVLYGRKKFLGQGKNLLICFFNFLFIEFSDLGYCKITPEYSC